MTRKRSVSNHASKLALAIALVAGPSEAVAQSFQGTGNIVTNTGGAAGITTGSGTTDITLNPGQTVIDWTPDDPTPGPIVIFQNSGTTATFSSTDDFAVLNRINVADNSRQVFMNGTIQSFINQSVGGDVFFYSPSGFVIGANAIINVGSLVLSASPITVDGNNNFINGGIVNFAQADPGAIITTVAGSQINALNSGSYVALVAPRVEHNGAIAVNGAAALVGAEAATINFRTDSLFDITVNMGTTDANGVVVGSTGSIGGPASTGSGDLHRAYLVAVPKNTAMTMLISSGADLGFDVAGAADVVGNAVVLSAGHDVAFGGSVSSPSFASGADADISIENASFTSAVDGRANGDIIASSVGGSLAFASDVSLTGRDLAKLEAGGDGNVTVGGNLTMSADASGENQGDSAQAGNVTLQAFAGGQLSVTGDTVLTAIGSGASSSTPGVAGGDGRAGTILVQATTGGDMFLGNVDSQGSLDANASGFGGGFFGDVDGGGGYGGTVNVFASGDGTLTVAGVTYLRVEGWAGQPSDCFQCGAVGGTGDAGTVNVQAHSGSASKLDFRDVLFVYADGHGGDGLVGGLGMGGDVSMWASGGGTVAVASDVSFATSGAGGNALSGAGDGGNGIGGGTGNSASVAAFTDGGTLTIGGDFGIISDGTGGNSAGGTGGTGTGGEGMLAANNSGTTTVAGVAAISASGTGGNGKVGGAGIGGSPANGGGAYFGTTGGTLTVTGLATLSAYGQGGAATGGAGGNATGGATAARASNGTAHFLNNLFIDAGATGGDGDVGGDATALVSPPADEGSTVAAGLYAQNNGSLDVDGLAVISTEAVGGNGSNGNGGNAISGEVDVVGFFGTIDIGSLVIDTNAFGGSGGNGGNGGNGNGGPVDVAFGLGAAAIGGTMTLGSVTITADGEGGDGGTGTSGNTGGNGGAGGSGSGGRVLFTGAAANGTLSTGTATVTSLGRGGDGGAGGNGDTGAGGNGGAGGMGTGGAIQTGTISAEAAPTSGGGAAYTTLSLNSSAFGGDGGGGGSGAGGTGTGGNGGAALGGSGSFLSRGALVTATSVTIDANANGGDGGSGSVQGNGGNARTGSIAVESKERFGHPDQRGAMNVGSIVGSAVAVGGFGTTNGTSSAIGSSYFRVLNGDATIGSLDFTIDAQTYDNTFASSFVSVRDGIATITGDFSFTTPGTLVLDASLGSMNAGTINLAAGSFTGPLTIDNVIQAQVGPGTYNASAINISTGGDFVTNAHLVSGGSLDIDAPGLINMRNATSTDGNVSLAAGSTIDGANLDAAGFVDVFANGNVALGNIDAGSSISAESLAGALTVNDLSAQTIIDLDAQGAILFRDVLTAGEFDFSGGSTVTGRDINATTRANGEAQGAIVLRDVTASGPPNGQDFSVGFASATSIQTGNVSGTGRVGFATAGSLTTGNLSGGSLVMTLAGGDVSTGSITTTQQNGQVYMADFSMFATGGGGPGTDFDESLVLPLDPVMTGGSIAINGPVSTSLFRAAAGTSFTAGDITALGFFDDVIFAQGIDVRAGGTATIDGTWTGESVDVTSNDIDITSSGSIQADGVALASTNATGTIIGDGVSGSGYRLSDAEYDRIHATTEIEVGVNGSLGGRLNMLIGDLSVDAESAGADEYEFATYQTDSEEGSGSIRVVGDMTFTNMSGVEIFRDASFTTGTFELDAATGSISLTGSGTELGGELGIQAVHIHVAEGSILDQLADDPQYDGYQADLNAPASTPQPGGVIRAASMGIDFDGAGEGEIYTLYVQNTGTAETPAGFVVGNADLGDESEGQGVPGSINLVINGQIDTGEGMLTGVDVRDALVANRDLTVFTANSTVNGCLLAGACVQTPNNPFPPGFTPTPGIQDEIVLIGDDPTPPPEFGNEDVIDDNDEETEDTSPIVPPQPLFDTSEMGEAEGTGNPAFNTTMRSHPGIVQEGDVDDPVSGGGNPALMEGDGPPPAPPAQPSGNEEKRP